MVSKRKQKQLDLENELCCNPFRKRRCGRADIPVYIMWEGEKLPICSKCWKIIAGKDWIEEDSKVEFVYVPCIEGIKTKKFKKKRFK